MSSPIVRGLGAYASGTTSFVATVPGGAIAPQANDAMYIIVESTNGGAGAPGTPNTPSGWTKLLETTTDPEGFNISTLTIFGKIAGVGETDVTINGFLNHGSGALIVIRNHGLAVITDTVIGSVVESTQLTGISIPSISVTAESLILMAFGLTDDSADTTNVSNVANGNLASIGEWIDECVATGNGGGVGIYTATCAGITTGSTTWDHDTAVPSQSVHLGIPPLAALSKPWSSYAQQ